MRRRARARWALGFLTTLWSGLASVAFVAVFSSMMTAGPPSVAIFVAATLPSSAGLSVAGTAAEGSGASAIAATFTSSLVTGGAASIGVTGVAAVVSTAA